jgi:hypothetical protein
MLPSPFKKIIFKIFFSWCILIFIDFPNLPVITGKFSPFTENLLLPVNEILYRTIITRRVGRGGNVGKKQCLIVGVIFV